MSTSLIIFILAVLAIVLFVGFRLYEFGAGTLVVSKNLRLSIERKVVAFYRKMILWFVDAFKATKLFLKELPRTLAHITHYYWRKFSKRVDDFLLRMRHKK